MTQRGGWHYAGWIVSLCVAAVLVALAAAKQHEHDERAFVQRDREELLRRAEVRLELRDYREVRRLAQRAIDDSESILTTELGVRAVRLYALAAVRDGGFRSSRAGAAISECGYVFDPIDSYERFLAGASRAAPGDAALARARWEVAATLPARAPSALAGLRRLDAQGALAYPDAHGPLAYHDAQGAMTYDAFALAALARLESDRGNTDATTSALVRCRGVAHDSGICEGPPAPSSFLHTPSTLALFAVGLGLAAYGVAVCWARRANRLRARLGWFLWIEVMFAAAAIMAPVLGSSRQPPMFGLVVAPAVLAVMLAVLFLHWAAAPIAWPDAGSGITFEAPELGSDERALPVLARTTSVGMPWIMITHRETTYRGSPRQAIGRVLPLPLAPLVVMSLLVIGGMYVTLGAALYITAANEETTRLVLSSPYGGPTAESTSEEGDAPDLRAPAVPEPSR
jgi:hypothetical protein